MLEHHQFKVTREDDDQRAMQRLTSEHFDVILVEMKAARDDAGLRFLRHVHATTPHLAPRIVVISNDPPPSVQRELEVIGVCDIVVKPVHEAEILAAIAECLDRAPAVVH